MLEFPSAAFDDAVASVCHGRASDGQLEALNRLLRENPAARDEYLLRIELHARLASEPDLLAPMEEADRTEADDALANGCGTADFIPTSVRGGLFSTASFGRRDAAAPRLAPPDSMVERGERRPGEAHPRGPRKAVSPGRWAKSSPIRRRVAWGVALAGTVMSCRPLGPWASAMVLIQPPGRILRSRMFPVHVEVSFLFDVPMYSLCGYMNRSLKAEAGQP